MGSIAEEKRKMGGEKKTRPSDGKKRKGNAVVKRLSAEDGPVVCEWFQEKEKKKGGGSWTTRKNLRSDRGGGNAKEDREDSAALSFV